MPEKKASADNRRKRRFLFNIESSFNGRTICRIRHRRAVSSSGSRDLARIASCAIAGGNVSGSKNAAKRKPPTSKLSENIDTPR
mmetsp:Transcript_19797/g.46854  ORF Transcript_19797/g.46854 Transcript_19797/m.46854 type:complete len:84 (+) Transcript_19797:422-673(+)